jgi:hypothetical protein
MQGCKLRIRQGEEKTTAAAIPFAFAARFLLSAPAHKLYSTPSKIYFGGCIKISGEP